jgi:hypothetical protein
MSPLYQLNTDLIRLNLPTALRYALLGLGGGLTGAVALMCWYWDDVQSLRL